jgi:ATP-dependent helicase HepA
VTRFGLEVFLDESVFVLPHDVSDDLLTALAGATLLVVDEAHHVAAPNDGATELSALYETLRQAARHTDGLLLLSATPILRNEAGFLRMLHLLDPIAYPLEDYEGFRHKIEQRQALAEVVAMLTPDNALFLDDPLDGLATRFPHDQRLQGLVHVLKEKLLEMPDEDDEDLVAQIRQLKAHVSETYRLNRRILRNRRKQVIGLTPNRKGARCWLTSDSPLSHAEAILEEWRIAACAAHGVDTTMPTVRALARFYWSLVTAYLDNPGVLARLCARRRALPVWPDGEALGRFEQEDALLARLTALCEDERWLDARCDRLLDGLASLPSTTKAVVFCSTEDVADKVFKHLHDASVKAVRHQTELNDEEDLDRPESWTAFMSDPSIGV